jgi:hypothetical protein
MNDDLRRRLEDAGKRPVPGPDPAFADTLEARLRAIASEPAAEPHPVAFVPTGTGRHSARFRFRLGIGGAVLAGVTAVAMLVGVLGRPGGPAAPPELSAPVNVVVALDDGTILEDPDGLRLPDGAVISVGAGGSARIGDIVLAPGDVARVEQGRLNVEHDQAVGSVPGTARPPGTPDTRPSPYATPFPSRFPGATPTRTPGSGGTAPTPSPARTSTPVPTATPESTRTAAPPTPSPSPTIVRPILRARVLTAPTRVRVTWTATPGAASYALVTTRSRGGTAARPVYPGSRILGVFSHPPATPLRFRVPDGVTEVKLMVVALRADGTVIARSRVITLAIPVTATTATPTAGDASRSPDPTPALGN